MRAEAYTVEHRGLFPASEAFSAYQDAMDGILRQAVSDPRPSVLTRMACVRVLAATELYVRGEPEAAIELLSYEIGRAQNSDLYRLEWFSKAQHEALKYQHALAKIDGREPVTI